MMINTFSRNTLSLLKVQLNNGSRINNLIGRNQLINVSKSKNAMNKRFKSSKSSSSMFPKQQNPLAANPLAADAGSLATHFFHTMSTGLLLAFPLYCMLPEDGMLSKFTGLALTIPFGVHSWIGLNHVGSDYVPKISKKLLQPARIAFVGMCCITCFGLTYLQLTAPGGMKGTFKGLWVPKKDATKIIEEEAKK